MYDDFEQEGIQNQEIGKYIVSLYEFMKEKLGFDIDVDIILLEDEQNAQQALGKTAYYVPRDDDEDIDKICVYTTGRHIKDILRSIGHELIHHKQNCDGQLQGISTEEGYAQKTSKGREVEKEAYTLGNIYFRDWEDGFKQGLVKDKGKQSMQEARFKRIKNRLMEGSLFYSNQEQTDYFHLNKSYNRYVQVFLDSQKTGDNTTDENEIGVDAFNGTLQSVLNPRLKNFGFALAESEPGKIYKYVDYQGNAIVYDVLADANRQYPLTVYYLKQGKLIEKRENIDFQTTIDRLQQLFNLDDGIIPKVRATGYTNVM